MRLLDDGNEAKLTLWTFWVLKQAAAPDIASPVPETAIQAFHITVELSLL